MEHHLALQCPDCGRRYDPADGRHRCPRHEDGATLQAVYDFEHFSETLDLLGASIDTAWRYADFFPIPAGAAPVTLGEGGTDVVDAATLGDDLGVDLSLKLESANPSGSTKDRGSSVFTTYATATDYRGVVCASTGNAAASLATYAARAGLEACVFVPDSAPMAKRTQPSLTGANVVAVDGTYGEARSLARTIADRPGWLDRSAGSTPFVAAGNRTLGYEIAEQAPEADWVVVPMGNGGTIAGVWEGLTHFHRCGRLASPPRLLGVQASGTNPIVASHEDTDASSLDGTTADSIDVPDPCEADAALSALTDSDGSAISVSEEAIVRAQQRLGHAEGVFAEPASAATLAGLEAARDSGVVEPGATAMLVVTGSGLKDAASARRAASDQVQVTPNVDTATLVGQLGLDD
ncbi:threonine synthase [Halobacteriales archaeon Cl-PHB]